ncbi:MAG: 50S ribosomal protein L11 methyltransferase [Betaproteobacteria bacterium]|nr:50S ribosomal protein L11 methyltransferase [Betaproteobacteria bacterium]
MSYWSITLEIPHAQADALGDALMACGAFSVDLADAREGTREEMPIFAEPGADSQLWALCRLKALLPASLDPRAVVSAAAQASGCMAADFVVEPVDDADWVALSRAQFQPLQVGRALWVVPSWHAVPQGADIAIRLDPGAAFGTGGHPTTRMCLQWLEENPGRVAGKQILDYGCGSGILAIAAMKLGAGSALGIDIDPVALPAARGNAADNGVEVTFIGADARVGQVFDLALANILANPLKALAPALAAHTRGGGSLVLAGLLDEQAPELQDLYQPWFDLSVWRSSEGWSCLAGTRRP